ncbi:MAG: hypothetical protein K8H88_11845, partial [Sandaracinaceae bacterium]|nr:hypothetical protein [Sandaracinaceae bacterium]
MWLDVEHDPAGRGVAQLEDQIQLAVEACGTFSCGIYTANWWWQPAMRGSEAFADLPLWYAHYDHDPDVGTWPAQRFGGWAEPWGKQFEGDIRVCGIDVDLNTIRVSTTASIAHPPPQPVVPGVPGAPVGLDPHSRASIPTWQDVRMLCAAVPGATSYDFHIQSYTGSSWADYYTYSSRTNARSFSPNIQNRTYRFRVRAKNASGTGTWSAWATFDYGTVTAPPPSEPPVEPPPVEPPPPTSDALSPADGTRITTSTVTLSRSSASGATRYEFAIEYWSGSAYASYYTYAGSAPSRTFYPVYANTAYRWRVRVTTSAGAQAWSSYQTFLFGAGAVAPGTPPGPPPPEPP